jgi:hypothetical protein
MDYVDYSLIFPAGETAMDPTIPTFLGFNLTQLPIMFLALATVCWLVSRGYIILPVIQWPLFVWQTIYWTRGRWWRIKNEFRSYWRWQKRETAIKWKLFYDTFLKQNPKTTDFNKLFTQQIKSTLEAELKAGHCNQNNVNDWLTRFSEVKGLEHLKPYVRKDKKLNTSQIEAHRNASKKRLTSATEYQITKYAAIDKMAPVNLRKKDITPSISTTTARRRVLKLKAA